MPFAVRRPVAALACVALAFAVSGAVLLVSGLRIDTGADAFIVKGDRTWRTWQRFHEQFGGEQVLVLGVRGPDALGRKGLERLDRIDHAIGDRATGPSSYRVGGPHKTADKKWDKSRNYARRRLVQHFHLVNNGVHHREYVSPAGARRSV